MGLGEGLQAGVSGLNAQGKRMATISHNVANSSTPAYKRTQIKFSTLVTSNASSSSFSPGGVGTSTFYDIDSQGNIQNSDKSTHIAVEGNGMIPIKLSPSNSVTNQLLLTRLGDFEKTKEGYLTNSSSGYLQGLPISDTGVVASNDIGNLQTVDLSQFNTFSRTTSSIEFDMNLPAEALVGDKVTSSIQVYDSLGVGHNMVITWERVATTPPNSGAWAPTVTSMTVASTGANSASTLPSVTPTNITFDVNGLPSADPTLSLNFTSVTLNDGAIIGNTSKIIAINLGSVGGTDGATMKEDGAGNISIRNKTQNGLPRGSLESVEISPDGRMTAIFDNGFKRQIYQIPMATVSNPNRLAELTGNKYSETEESGTILLKTPGSDGAGTISSSKIEGSKVELAQEFTDMIYTQRAFGGNTKTIKTIDDMLAELMQIKR